MIKESVEEARKVELETFKKHGVCVVRACFRAKARGTVCVELLHEDFEEGMRAAEEVHVRNPRCSTELGAGVRGDDEGGGLQAGIVQRVRALPRAESREGGSARRRLHCARAKRNSRLAPRSCARKNGGEVQGPTGAR